MSDWEALTWIESGIRGAKCGCRFASETHGTATWVLCPLHAEAAAMRDLLRRLERAHTTAIDMLVRREVCRCDLEDTLLPEARALLARLEAKP